MRPNTSTGTICSKPRCGCPACTSARALDAFIYYLCLRDGALRCPIPPSVTVQLRNGGQVAEDYVGYYFWDGAYIAERMRSTGRRRAPSPTTGSGCFGAFFDESHEQISTFCMSVACLDQSRVRTCIDGLAERTQRRSKVSDGHKGSFSFSLVFLDIWHGRSGSLRAFTFLSCRASIVIFN